jgi:hypothetical protein
MFHFKHPTTVLIAGPTQCGKTHFLINALRRQLIQPPPQNIVWVFSEWQVAYTELAREIPQIQFVKNFNAQLYEMFDVRRRNVLVLDDQMENQHAHKRSSDSVVKFFTQGSHHRNLTVVYIVQNLFNQDKSMRTVSLNAHYITVFKNPRDATQLRTLACQMYPENPAPLLDAFKDATAIDTDAATSTYGYLLLDLHPTTCDAFRMLTKVFDEHPTAYVPEEYIKSAILRSKLCCPSNVLDDASGIATALSGNRRVNQHADAQHKTQGNEGYSKANRQVLKCVQQPGCIPQCTEGINRRRDQGDLQRSTKRRARRYSPYTTTASAL